MRNTLAAALLFVGLAAIPSGCGCGSPVRRLPDASDPAYASLERLIERTLKPTIDVFAADRHPSGIEKLVSLGYFHRTRDGYMPTAYGHRHSSLDTWPTALGEFYREKYDQDDHISFPIGTYAVETLRAAYHYPGVPCGSYGDEHDAYDFVGAVRLNSLGKALLNAHLLFTWNDATRSPRRWDGQRMLNDKWSDLEGDEHDGYIGVLSYGESLDLESSLLHGS